MRVITVLSLCALGAVIAYIDPESSGAFGAVLFYLVSFFVLSGIFNLILLFIRRKLLGNELAAKNIELSLIGRNVNLLSIGHPVILVRVKWIMFKVSETFC